MLADYVNALRIKNKMTIEEVARLSDIPEPTVKNVLTKKTLNPGFEVGLGTAGDFVRTLNIDRFFIYGSTHFFIPQAIPKPVFALIFTTGSSKVSSFDFSFSKVLGL